MDPPNAFFPLENIDEAHLQKLCRTLWRWNWCDVCTSGQPCGSLDCDWKRWKRLEPFFEFYKACTASYVPDLMIGTFPALSIHEDLLNIIQLLQHKRASSRETLIGEYFLTRGEDSRPDESDMHRAFNLAFKVMTMVTCSGESQPADLFDTGSEPVEWRNGASLSQFFESIFPIRDHPTLNDKDESGIDIKSQLKAVRLQSIAGLKFCGTDNLRDHLRLNHETGIVELYHHTSVLKEHLKMGGPKEGDMTKTEKLQRSVLLSSSDSLLEEQPDLTYPLALFPDSWLSKL